MAVESLRQTSDKYIPADDDANNGTQSGTRVFNARHGFLNAYGKAVATCSHRVHV